MRRRDRPWSWWRLMWTDTEERPWWWCITLAALFLVAGLTHGYNGDVERSAFFLVIAGANLARIGGISRDKASAQIRLDSRK